MKYIGLILCLVLTVCAGYPSMAQQTQAYVAPGLSVSSTGYNDTSTDVITIQKRVDEVNVLFIAMDKHGKFVRDLKEGDFHVLDDHKPPQSIVRFSQQTDLPLQLGLLIDTSGSIHGRFEFEQNAAAGFLQHTIRAHYDHAFVMGFNTRSSISQEYTDNVALLQTGVHHLEDGGGTALYDAIYSACKTHMMNDDSDRPVRRALVVVSDGEDNQSEHSRAQAIEMAQRAQVIIYTISTDDSGLILRGDRVLQQLADSTGGRAFFPYKMKDIKNSFAAIEDELRSQYVISYHPADFDADGRYRSIQITALKKDLQVRARTGYFAPKQ
ncbi:MAG TPA: VWA domain-containing protein [Terriglobales bacterium]|jgi:Ca-activated chloride channel family protein|nr:VWA domain-containing protein [Terriglobales bacterium]